MPAHRTLGMPVAYGHEAVAISAPGPCNCLEWRITAEGDRPDVGIILRLSAEDVVQLGQRCVAALEARCR